MGLAHTAITQKCLGILLHSDKNVTITRDNLKRFPLSEYVPEHWLEHACFRGMWQNAKERMKHLFLTGGSHILRFGSGYATQQSLNERCHPMEPPTLCYHLRPSRHCESLGH